jgi:hypothetical protein
VYVRPADARGALLCYEALAELQVFLGDALGARGSIATALRSCRPNARFLRVAGLIEKRLGDLDAAAGLLRRSVAVDPRDSKSWLAVRTVLGWSHRQDDAWLAELGSEHTQQSLWARPCLCFQWLGLADKAMFA